MRVAVLPRDVAAGVITGSVSRIAWAVGAVSLLLNVPVLIETFARAGVAAALPAPLLLTALQLLLLLLAAWRGTPLAVGAYLLCGAAALVAFQLSVLAALPGATDLVFLLNRSAVALVLVGVVTTSTVVGVTWIGLGYIAATVGSVTAAALAGVPYRPGLGPTMVAVMAAVAYLTFVAIQRAQRRRVPNFDELEAETQRLAVGEDLARRTTAVVHDTLLNDLSIVMNGPDRLDARAQRRLEDDLDTLTSADWLSTAVAVAPADDQDAEVRNAISEIISEFQWRGLTVELSGAGSGIYRLDPAVAEALIAAIRVALENVVRHSGAESAEIVLAYTEQEITVMVIDQGAGFDPAAVPDDRLGLRTSIVERVEAVGGRVDVWSAPDAGTSVIMTAPIERVVRPHERSTHRDQPDSDGSAGGADA